MLVLIPILMLLMSATVFAALGLFVFKSWKELQADRPGSIQHEILDRLDRIEMRLDLLSERVRAGNEAEALEAGEGPGTLPDEGSAASRDPYD